MESAVSESVAVSYTHLHGENTPGKRSPDGVLREYAYAREIADDIVRELTKRGYDACLLYTSRCV